MLREAGGCRTRPRTERCLATDLHALRLLTPRRAAAGSLTQASMGRCCRTRHHPLQQGPFPARRTGLELTCSVHLHEQGQGRGSSTEPGCHALQQLQVCGGHLRRKKSFEATFALGDACQKRARATLGSLSRHALPGLPTPRRGAAWWKPRAPSLTGYGAQAHNRKVHKELRVREPVRLALFVKLAAGRVPTVPCCFIVCRRDAGACIVPCWSGAAG